jgi:RNA polymerase sigma-70 factor (ECF subfamily)
MREIALTDIERLGAFEDAERTFQMNEEAFRAFYEQTARPVWVYLARMTADPRLADDLLQEAYYRFLRATAVFESDDHRRHYLFRIATNLVHDHRRKPRTESTDDTNLLETPPPATRGDEAGVRATSRIDLERAMQQLKPRERSLLWLAYAQGCTHQEIAATLGLRTSSLKALLFRARQHLLRVLNEPRPGGRS